ncbi:NAD(P)/FAD-dependent oxidoreductase [candidate division WOR-3 bacterium]|nr:NAD(P)/FAD-dependent oxidoreductase [candidate division WOR-3 bacterium]
MKIKDVIIIGGGPAGISCAIQLTRYDIEPLILEKEKLGGLLVNANYLENYLGFPRGIKGKDLTELLKEQLKKHKINVFFEEVMTLVSNKDFFEVTTNKSSYDSKFLVIASGTKPKEFKECPIPDKLAPKIFYEVYPLIDLKNKKIVIVGAGDAAFDYALNLSRENKVVILNRSESSNCLPVLLRRARESAEIDYIKNIKIQRISSSYGDRVKLECLTPEGSKNIEADFLLFAIGRMPCLDFLSAELSREVNEVKKNSRMYLAGDVKNGIFRQTAIAVGDGIMSAMKIYNKIKEEEK